MARRIVVEWDCPGIGCDESLHFDWRRHRRVLDPGSYVLIEKVDGKWSLPIKLGLYDYQGGPVDIHLMFDYIAHAQADRSCRCGGKGFGSYVVEGWAGNDIAYVDCPDCSDALAEGEQP